MSLKAIEMQIAIPRTIDVSKMQSEFQDRPQVINAQVSLAVRKETERNRKTVIQNDELYHTEWKTGSNTSQSQELSISDEVENKCDELSYHPFKGHFIDYQG